MYRVKNNGKGSTAFFDNSMEREALARMKIEQSLRLAILEKRFCCAFQAKVDIRTQEVKGIEALVRLRDDEGVIQAPGTFINLAVELGLIDELTFLVLAEIVKSIDLINDTFGPAATISINVAAKQASNVEFMRRVRTGDRGDRLPEALHDRGDRGRIRDPIHFQDEILPLLRGIGVGISIDDFGIGYSSLSALADITADEIKIDRSFITDIHKRPRSRGHPARDRIAERGARHDRDRRGHRDPTRNSPICRRRPRSAMPRATTSPSRSSSRIWSAGNPRRQRGARQHGGAPGPDSRQSYSRASGLGGRGESRELICQQICRDRPSPQPSPRKNGARERNGVRGPSRTKRTIRAARTSPAPATASRRYWRRPPAS